MAWLSLKISGSPAPSPQGPKKNPVKIIVPKKTAKLATRRNRLRRLIKEALRLEFKLSKDKIYVFRVLKDPGEIGLEKTKEAIHALWQPS